MYLFQCVTVAEDENSPTVIRRKRPSLKTSIFP